MEKENLKEIMKYLKERYFELKERREKAIKLFEKTSSNCMFAQMSEIQRTYNYINKEFFDNEFDLISVEKKYQFIRGVNMGEYLGIVRKMVKSMEETAWLLSKFQSIKRSYSEDDFNKMINQADEKELEELQYRFDRFEKIIRDNL